MRRCTGCGVVKDAANSQNGAISQGGVLTKDGAFYRIGVAQDAASFGRMWRCKGCDDLIGCGVSKDGAFHRMGRFYRTWR